MMFFMMLVFPYSIDDQFMMNSRVNETGVSYGRPGGVVANFKTTNATGTF